MFFKKSYHKISADSVKDMLKSDKNTLLLDVREKDEYRSGYIAQSKNIPVGHLHSMKNRLPKDKATPIITYCLSGMRAKTACRVLAQLGYNNLYCLGGLQAWPFGFKR